MHNEKWISFKSSSFFHLFHAVKYKYTWFVFVVNHVLDLNYKYYSEQDSSLLTEVKGKALTSVFVTVLVKSILRLFNGTTTYSWVMDVM